MSGCFEKKIVRYDYFKEISVEKMKNISLTYLNTLYTFLNSIQRE